MLLSALVIFAKMMKSIKLQNCTYGNCKKIHIGNLKQTKYRLSQSHKDTASANTQQAQVKYGVRMKNIHLYTVWYTVWHAVNPD